MSYRKNTLFISAIIFLACLLGTAQAQPGSGVRLGKQTLVVPEVSVSYNYTDNLNVRERALDTEGERLDEDDPDSSMRSKASVIFTQWNDFARFRGGGWYSRRDFFDRTDLDEDTYGADGSLFWARKNGNTTVSLEGAYQRAIEQSEISSDFVADNDISQEFENVSERVEREEVRLSGSIDQRLMQNLRGSIKYAYKDVAYEVDRFNDRTSYDISGEANYQWSPKTQPYAEVGIGYDDDDGFEDTAEKPFYLIGVRYNPTAKLDVDVAVGYETYTRTPSEGVDEGVELEDSGAKWSVDIKYAVTDKTKASLSGRTGYNSVASPGSSSREEISATFAITNQTTNQIFQRVSASWREDDYISPFPARGGLFDEVKETLYFQYRIDYQTVRPWLSLFAQASYEDGDSQVPGDSYTQTEFAVGATARY